VEALTWDREIERLDRSYREVLAGDALPGEGAAAEAVVNL
jgi:hypothetical protein